MNSSKVTSTWMSLSMKMLFLDDDFEFHTTLTWNIFRNMISWWNKVELSTSTTSNRCLIPIIKRCIKHLSVARTPFWRYRNWGLKWSLLIDTFELFFFSGIERRQVKQLFLDTLYSILFTSVIILHFMLGVHSWRKAWSEEDGLSPKSIFLQQDKEPSYHARGGHILYFSKKAIWF